MVGVRLFMRWDLEAAGRRLRAVRAVDTATDPDFRGRGIFRTLTLELLRALEAANEVDLVFNTPNGSSKPGYLKMCWHDVGTVPVHVGVARPLRFLRGVRSASASCVVWLSAPMAACVTPPAVSAEFVASVGTSKPKVESVRIG